MSEENPKYTKFIKGLPPDTPQDQIAAYKAHYEMAFDPLLLAKGRKKQSPSNELTDYIIKKAKELGGTARRVNTQGQYDQSTGKWRTSGMRKGFEDVDICLPVRAITKQGPFKLGIKVGVEVKIGNDKLSEHQVTRLNELKDAGGYYLIASNKEQISMDLDNLKETLTQLFQ